MSWNGPVLHDDYTENEKYMDDVFEYFLSFAPQFGHKDRIDSTHGWVTQVFEIQEDMSEWFIRSFEDNFVTEFLDFATNSLVSQHPLVQKWWLSDSQLSQIFDDIGSSVYDEYNENSFKNFDVIMKKKPIIINNMVVLK
jgi:hypothetical protein